MIQTLVTLPLAFGFYLLLAGALGVEQLVSAGVMTLIAIAWSALLRLKGGPRRFAFDRSHVAPWARAIARIPADTGRIGATLVRAAATGGSPGHAAEVPFRFGRNDDAREAARRASAVLAGSLTPDTFVIDIAPGHATALAHKLARTPAPDDAEWLI